MRPHDLRHGGVALYEVKPILGLSEYMSRHCRLRLVEACARGLERELSERCDTGVSHLDPRVGAASVLAGILDVSPRTVQRWLSGGVQSCNVNAEKLIQASLEHAPEETKRLLAEDLAQHKAELERLLEDLADFDHAEEDLIPVGVGVDLPGESVKNSFKSGGQA